MHPGKIVNVLCVGSGHRLHIPTSGTDNPGLQNLFWWVQCCFYVKNLINDLLLCTFIYICSRRSCAERTWNKEYGTFLGSLHLMHGKGKSGLITRQGCPGERDNQNRTWRKTETRSGPLPSTSSSYLWGWTRLAPTSNPPVQLRARGTPQEEVEALGERCEDEVEVQGGQQVLCAKRQQEAAWRWKPRGAVLEILWGVSREII